MKVIGLVILALAVAASYADVDSAEVPSVFGYHSKFGIARAAEIRRLENEALRSGEPLSGQRIVGGTITDISEVPYQVGLVIQIVFILTSVCGGSLISSTRVVSAAHCASDGILSAQSYTVVLGSNTLFSDGTRIPTNDVVVHQNWTPSTAANDIMVLRIPTVTFSYVIQPIALPSGGETNDNFVGRTGVASGFGLTIDGGSIGTAQRISSVNLTIITNAACAAVYGPFVHASNICTSGAGGQGTCQGDSGGPLAVWNNGRPILTGVTSFGAAEGCSAGHPAAYARITTYLSWLLSLLD